MTTTARFNDELSLPDQDGKPTKLRSLINESKGMVILSFRGHW